MWFGDFFVTLNEMVSTKKIRSRGSSPCVCQNFLLVVLVGPHVYFGVMDKFNWLFIKEMGYGNENLPLTIFFKFKQKSRILDFKWKTKINSIFSEFQQVIQCNLKLEEFSGSQQYFLEA